MLLANTLCQRRETQEAKTNKSGGMLRMKEQNLANKMEKITQDQVGLGKRLTSWTPYKIIRKAPNAEICPQTFSFSFVEQNSSMVLFKSLWSLPLFFRRIAETSHPRNEENFRRRKHQEPKYLTLSKEKESTKQLCMRRLSILQDPTFSTHNNTLIHLSTSSNLSCWWSFSSLVSIFLCDNAQLISNRHWNKPEAYWSCQYLHSLHEYVHQR